MLKLKLQYFSHLMRRTDSLEKTMLLGKIEDGRRKERQRMRWLDDLTDLMDVSWTSSGIWCWTGKPGILQSMGLQRVGHKLVTEVNWTDRLHRWLSGKEPTCQFRRHVFHPWVRKLPWRREQLPTLVFCLENYMDREAWWATVLGITKNWKQLNNSTIQICFLLLP